MEHSDVGCITIFKDASIFSTPSYLQFNKIIIHFSLFVNIFLLFPTFTFSPPHAIISLIKGGVLMEISDGMDIASYAIMNSQLQISQGVSTQVLKKTMDLQEAQGIQLVQMMEQSVNPGLGQNIDIRI